jgi:hypothetical protein
MRPVIFDTVMLAQMRLRGGPLPKSSHHLLQFPTKELHQLANCPGVESELGTNLCEQFWHASTIS